MDRRTAQGLSPIPVSFPIGCHQVELIRPSTAESERAKYAFAAVAGNRVMVAVTGTLECRDGRGRKSWRRDWATRIEALGFWGEDVLVVASDGLSRLRISDGREIWQTTRLSVGLPLVVDNEMIVLAQRVPGSSSLLAASLPSCATLWRAPISPARLVISSQAVVVTTHLNVIHSLEPTTGAEIWRLEMPEEVGGIRGIAVIGKTVIVVTRSGVRLLAVEDGALRRHIVLPEIATPNCQITTEQVFLLGQTDFIEVNWRSGRASHESLRSEMLTLGSTVHTGPFLVTKEALLWVSEGGAQLYGLSRGARGRRGWRAGLEGALLPNWSPPAICGSFLYVPNLGAGGVHVFESSPSKSGSNIVQFEGIAATSKGNGNALPPKGKTSRGGARPRRAGTPETGV